MMSALQMYSPAKEHCKYMAKYYNTVLSAILLCIVFSFSYGCKTQVISSKPHDVNLGIKGFTLRGRIKNVYPEGLVQYRYAVIKPGDRLRLWIYHLALNSLPDSPCPRKSILMGLSRKGGKNGWIAWEYPPIENSLHMLEGLLARYWTGLMRPLHFFPRSSWEYAEGILNKDRSEDDALDRAKNVWIGNDYNPGEGGDSHYQLCFRDTDPLDFEFMDASGEVFGPLIAHQIEI